MSFGFRASFAFYVALGMVGMASAEDSWKQWRGPNRDGKSSETGINVDWAAKEPKLVWMTEGFGQGFASVAIADGKIFTTGNFDEGQAVVAADLASGAVVWKALITEGKPKHDYEGSRSPPTIEGDRMWVVGSGGSIACLKVADGAIVWKRDFADFDGKRPHWGHSESPLVDGDLVLCTPGNDKAALVALDKNSGKDVWACALPKLGGKGKEEGAYSSIVVSNGAGVKQYVQLSGRGLFGVSADGKFLWGTDVMSNRVANISTPIIDGDFVFCSTAYGAGATLVKLTKDGDGVKADQQYFLKADTMQNHHGGMVLIDGYLYFGNGQNQGNPMCVEMKSGDVKWKATDAEKPAGGSAAVLAIDGHLIFRFQDGPVSLLQATPEGMKVKGTFKPAHKERESWAHPVVVGKKLYLREQGKLMCYDLAK